MKKNIVAINLIGGLKENGAHQVQTLKRQKMRRKKEHGSWEGPTSKKSDRKNQGNYEGNSK